MGSKLPTLWTLFKMQFGLDLFSCAMLPALVHSPNPSYSWGWPRLRPRAWNSIWVSRTRSSDPSTWITTTAVRGTQSAGSWDSKQSQDMKPDTVLRDSGITGGGIWTALLDVHPRVSGFSLSSISQKSYLISLGLIFSLTKTRIISHKVFCTQDKMS